MLEFLSTAAGIGAVLFTALFVTSATYVVFRTEFSDRPAFTDGGHGWLRLAFATQLVLCMVGGMAANFVWTALQAPGGSIATIQWQKFLLPLLVSPIVFLGIWGMWPDKDRPSLVLVLVAFQNGFFWQVVFSNALPPQ